MSCMKIFEYVMLAIKPVVLKLDLMRAPFEELTIVLLVKSTFVTLLSDFPPIHPMLKSCVRRISVALVHDDVANCQIRRASDSEAVCWPILDEKILDHRAIYHFDLDKVVRSGSDQYNSKLNI